MPGTDEKGGQCHNLRPTFLFVTLSSTQGMGAVSVYSLIFYSE